jgi:hypothetical protein
MKWADRQSPIMGGSPLLLCRKAEPEKHGSAASFRLTGEQAKKKF